MQFNDVFPAPMPAKPEVCLHLANDWKVLPGWPHPIAAPLSERAK
ncbi:hypothetical protein RISK_002136 [Rhodopirellula islandica]|uniref:Uncharacterized protein n=1 Tax=Rhodopirellula islandica TaxID=595434 RepID=A0A0J1EJ04_RHOIS|nr:hypothetical protein RISK_002136 [Rhodopirellula islandica]